MNTKILAISIAAIFAVGAASIGFQESFAGVSPTNFVERDNLVLNGIVIPHNERVIVLDNAGGWAFEGLATTSSVEVTARFNPNSSCSVDVITTSVVAWTTLVDSFTDPFPITGGSEVNAPVHGDANEVIAVSVYGGNDGCNLKAAGNYVSVSTRGSAGDGLP